MTPLLSMNTMNDKSITSNSECLTRKTANKAADVEDGVDLEELMSDYESDNGWNLKAILYCCLSFTAADISYSMIVPFVPSSAKQRGLTTSMTGCIFAIFQLCNFITCFLIPKINTKYGGVKILRICNFGQAVTTACLALTTMIGHKNSYFAVMVLLRGLQGIFAAGSEVSAGGISVRSVPREMVGEALAYVELARMIGIILGPIVGGVMFQTIGYAAPFLLMAAILGGLSAAMIFFPIDKRVDNKDEQVDKSDQGKLLMSPVVQILILVVVSISAAVAFLDPLLENFMTQEPYFLDNLEVGAVYSSFTVTFGLTGAISGLITKKIGSVPAIFLATTINGLAYNIIAPPQTLKGPLTLFSFLHQSSRGGAIGLAVSAILLIGISAGIGMVPGTELMFAEGEFLGHSVEKTSDNVAMIMDVSFSLGCAIGPFISGSIVQGFDFSRACALFGICVLLFGIVASTVLGIIFHRRKAAQSSDTHTDSTDLATPLIERESDSPQRSRRTDSTYRALERT